MSPESSDSALGEAAPDARQTTALIAFAVSASGLLGLYQVRTFDTFFHLATGRLILAQHAVPAVDPFSFTFRGAPWQNHSWGFQVAMALLERAGGFAALSLWQALLAAATSAIALLAIRHDPARLAWAALLAVLATAGFREVLEARPHMLAYLCTALCLHCVLDFDRSASPRSLSWLLPVYLLWASAHGSHVLLFAILALSVFACAITRRAKQAGQLLLALGVCLACGLLLAPAAFLQGGEHMASSFLETSVKEWAPVTSEILFTTFQGRTFLALAVLAAVGLAHEAHTGERTRSLVLPGLLLLSFVLLGFTSARMLALFVLATGPVWLPLAARTLAGLTMLFGSRSTSRAANACAALGVLLLTGSVLALGEPSFRVGVGLMEERLPIAALASMRERARIKRVYNAYNFGAYLLWQAYPEAGVFVDGRAITVYPAAFLEAFDQAYQDPGVFERLAAQFAIDGVLLPSASPRTQRLLAYLKTQARFRVSYQDAVATVFELR